MPALILLLTAALTACGSRVVDVSERSQGCNEAYAEAHNASDTARALLTNDHAADALVPCASAPRKLDALCKDEIDPSVVDLRKSIDGLCHRDVPLAVAKVAVVDVERAHAGETTTLPSCLRLEHALGILVTHHHERETDVRPLVEAWQAACAH